ncbi:hypothetical protein EDB19DRAFT_1347609 [Suillus lakei]|nr:hypothetical protein EDB19DRAFT_1347609 [Suillus lakei]
MSLTLYNSPQTVSDSGSIPMSNDSQGLLERSHLDGSDDLSEAAQFLLYDGLQVLLNMPIPMSNDPQSYPSDSEGLLDGSDDFIPLHEQAIDMVSEEFQIDDAMVDLAFNFDKEIQLPRIPTWVKQLLSYRRSNHNGLPMPQQGTSACLQDVQNKMSLPTVDQLTAPVPGLPHLQTGSNGGTKLVPPPSAPDGTACANPYKRKACIEDEDGSSSSSLAPTTYKRIRLDDEDI